MTLEFQLSSSNVLSLGYVGQHGTHLVIAMPYFQKQLVNGQILPSPYLAGNPDLTSRITQISGTCSCANRKHNALQTSLHKRFSRGLEYQVSYTWAKADGLLGGWQLGGIYTAHSGFPLTIKMSGDPSGTIARSFRANSPIFSSPASQTMASTLFGQIRGSQGERNVELAAKFYF